jgi:hypothetical protein
MTNHHVKQLVLEMMAAHSIDAANLFNKEFHHPEREHLDLVAQLRDVSTYWRIQLADMSPSTLRIRASILDGVSVSTWLMLFERDVLPFIINYWVPYKLKDNNK